MRVIAGEYRRRGLVAPRGLATRPTTGRLRETLFNVLAPRIEGARFLDLYAGSGANGIEALSRGAAHVVFVENAAPAVTAIRANLAALQVPAGRYSVDTRAVSTSLLAAARKAGEGAAVAGSGSYDLVFLDPPYEDAEAYATTLDLLGGEAAVLLAPGAIVVAEHRRARRGVAGAAPAERHGGLERTRVLEQGDAALSFYALTR